MYTIKGEIRISSPFSNSSRRNAPQLAATGIAETRIVLLDSGFFVAAGYEATEKILRGLDFKGEVSKDLHNLYASIREQNPQIERKAQKYLFGNRI